MKNKKKIIIILVAILLVLGIGVTVFILILNKDNDTSDDEIKNLGIEPVDAEAFYKENGEIISKTKATDSKNVTSEKETIEILTERGFTEYSITTNFSMDGSYVDEKEIEGSSSEAHPMYTTYYVSSGGDLWTIELINGCITAYPVSYNENSDLKVPTMICEDDTTVSYDSVTNTFFETIPSESSVIIKKIDKIDRDSLDKLTKEGIDNL